MKLVELNPRWIGHGGEGVANADGSPVPRRERIGLSFDCPCGCQIPCAVLFANPPDGGPPIDGTTWQREGETFEALTLTPSILRLQPCPNKWHGWIRNGEIVSC